MFRELLGFFLVVHALGDFYFQSEKLAGRKTERYGFVALHAAVYLVVSLACAALFWSLPLAIAAGILSVLHFAMDTVKFVYAPKARAKYNVAPDTGLDAKPAVKAAATTAAAYEARFDAAAFVVDQIIHLVCIAAAALTLTLISSPLELLSGAEKLMLRVTETPLIVLAWAGVVLLVIKPANVMIKKLTGPYRPEDDAADIRKAGAFIGTLERLLILLLMCVGQYAAIGLVLTAKSVARYNKIAENKQFAEYYLLGTLLSVLFAVGVFLLLI